MFNKFEFRVIESELEKTGIRAIKTFPSNNSNIYTGAGKYELDGGEYFFQYRYYCSGGNINIEEYINEIRKASWERIAKMSEIEFVDEKITKHTMNTKNFTIYRGNIESDIYNMCLVEGIQYNDICHYERYTDKQIKLMINSGMKKLEILNKIRSDYRCLCSRVGVPQNAG